jgi:ribonucleoside-diphosphate reductase alpha chain
MAPGDRRHPCTEEQQRHRGQQGKKLDYSIQITKLFYERFMNEEDITLISPHQAPGLYEAYGTEDFDDLYLKYEADKTIPKKNSGRHRICLETY